MSVKWVKRFGFPKSLHGSSYAVMIVFVDQFDLASQLNLDFTTKAIPLHLVRTYAVPESNKTQQCTPKKPEGVKSIECLFHDQELGKEEVDEKDSEKTLKQWPHCEEVSYGAIHKG
nr:replication protein A 70 kDa DNA-binding subunit D-like [Ipomoea batatas]GMD81084.1 replication protein A 70 kDa DNA-binding subunit D-like [Ipomoea batatas]